MKTKIRWIGKGLRIAGERKEKEKEKKGQRAAEHDSTRDKARLGRRRYDGVVNTCRSNLDLSHSKYINYNKLASIFKSIKTQWCLNTNLL